MDDTDLAATRRLVPRVFSSVGPTSTSCPGCCGKSCMAQEAASSRAALRESHRRDGEGSALAVAGSSSPRKRTQAMVAGVNQSLERDVERREFAIDPEVPPSLVLQSAGSRHEPRPQPNRLRMSKAPARSRPANLEELAHMPVLHLAHLLKTSQVTSVELTEIYQARLRKYGPGAQVRRDLHRRARQKQARRPIGRSPPKNRGPPTASRGDARTHRGAGLPDDVGRAGVEDAGDRRRSDRSTAVARGRRRPTAKLATGEMAGGEYWYGVA